MVLEKKNAVIFAAGGALGAAAARKLASEGARVFLSGRTEASVERVAGELNAPWEHVDAADEAAVTAWVDRIAAQVDGIDIVFNAIGPRPTDADYAAHQHCLRSLPPRVPVPDRASRRPTYAASWPGCDRVSVGQPDGTVHPVHVRHHRRVCAVEALARTLAAEFGPVGIRINCVRAGAMPETSTIAETTANMARTTGVERDEASRPTTINVLRRPLRVDETAATVAWVASDFASGVAGQVVNVCAGAIVSR